MLPEELPTNKMGIMEETAEMVLEKKNLHETPPHCSTLEVYNETHILFPCILRRMWSNLLRIDLR